MKYSLIHKALSKIGNAKRQYQWSKLKNKYRFNALDVFIISGDPRGGTTWLAEIINEYDKTALIWEPLWLGREMTFRDLNFSYRQFIPENETEPLIKEKFDSLFSGKILNNHLCQFIHPLQINEAGKLLIKFCRANQLLPWLTNQFQFNYDPIYLVRHPCAVVASQLKQGGWNHISNKFQIPYNKLYPDFYTKHEEFLNNINSKVQVLAANWCLCNFIPLNHPENNKKWITMTYESLVINGEDQLRRIEDRWGVKLPESSYQKLQKASATTVKGSPILEQKGSQLEYWKKQLSEQNINEILDVLKYFNIDLYNINSLPNKSFE